MNSDNSENKNNVMGAEDQVTPDSKSLAKPGNGKVRSLNVAQGKQTKGITSKDIPKRGISVDKPTTSKNIPKKDKSVDKPITSKDIPKRGTSVDRPITLKDIPKKDLSADKPITSKNIPKKDLSADRPITSKDAPKKDLSVDKPITSKDIPKRGMSVDRPTTSKDIPKKDLSVDNPITSKDIPKRGISVDRPTTSKDIPKRGTSVDRPTTSKDIPKRGISVDRPTTSKDIPKRGTSVDKPITSKDIPKRGISVDRPTTSKDIPKRGTSVDRPTTSKDIPKKGTSVDKPITSKDIPKKGTSVDRPTTSKDIPKKGTSVDKPITSKDIPKRGTSVDRRTTSKDIPKKGTSVDRPTTSKDIPKKGTSVDKPITSKDIPKRGTSVDRPTTSKDIPKKDLSVDTPITSKDIPKIPNTKPASTKLSKGHRSKSCPPTKTTGSRQRAPGTTDAIFTTAEKNKLKVFEIAKAKLKEMQSDFMGRCENVNDIKGLLKEPDYKFVGFVLHENCKLIVSDIDLLRLPKIIPPDSISDFKERIRLCVDSGLNMVYEHLKDIKLCKNEIECRYQVECIRESLAKSQQSKVDALQKQIDVMFKDCQGNIDDDLSNTLRDLHDTRRDYRIVERKFMDLKKQNAEEQFKVDCAHRKTLDEVEKERDALENMLMNQINEYEIQYESQSGTMGNKQSLIRKKNSDIWALKKQANELNTSMEKLTGRLKQLGARFKSARGRAFAKAKIILALQKQLLHAREHIQKMQNGNVIDKFSYNDKDKTIVELQMQSKSLEAKNNALEAEVQRRQVVDQQLSELQIEHRRAMMEVGMLKEQLLNKSASNSVCGNAEGQ